MEPTFLAAAATALGSIVGASASIATTWLAQRTQSMAVGVLTGVAVGAILAYLITIGSPYLWEIVLPGSAVGLIVGIATMKYRSQ